MRDALNDFIALSKDRAFVWGKNDCLTFTNDAWRAMYGLGWAEDWLGRYMLNGRPMRRKELKTEFGFSSFYDAVDARLTMVDHVPPLGALVTTKHCRRWVTGVAMGICTGTRAAFLDKDGIIFLSINDIDRAWTK
jgi:hypothetical protein